MHARTDGQRRAKGCASLYHIVRCDIVRAFPLNSLEIYHWYLAAEAPRSSDHVPCEHTPPFLPGIVVCRYR